MIAAGYAREPLTESSDWLVIEAPRRGGSR
jgi:hypothetical protein